MTIRIGNAPCSWGVEFAGDPRNPPWRTVLKECAAAGYRGIELGPIGFMPEDPAVLGEALAEEGLTLIGGVVFRPFHDPAKWSEVVDASERTCKALVSHGARHLVLIDSISPRRAPTAGRAAEAEQIVSLALPTRQRGWQPVPRLRLETRFPLGIWCAWTWWQPALRVLVYPQPEPPGTPLPARMASSGDGQARGAGEQDLAALRPWQGGDSPRRIAWKAMARTASEDLIVRQYEGGDLGEL